MLKNGGHTYYIIYNGYECKFIPKNPEEKNRKDEILGEVLYIENGAYNPSSWYREVAIKKEDIKIKY